MTTLRRVTLVTLIQRFGPFGCAINLNLHLHTVALDGVYTKDGETPRVHEVSAPSRAEMQGLLYAIVSRVLRYLEHDGLLIRDPEQRWLDLESRDALDTLGVASIQYRIAVGPHAGRKALMFKRVAAAAPRSPSTVPKSLHGGTRWILAERRWGAVCVRFAADQREGIERLCRYVPGPRAGPALALQRLSTNGAGQVVYQLKAPYRDGTTHFVFEPLEFTTHINVRGPAGSLRLCKSALLPICPGPPGSAGAKATRQSGPLPRDRHDCGPRNARHRSRVVPATPGRRRRSHAQARAQALGRTQPARDQHPPTTPITWMERRVTATCSGCSRLICAGRAASARTAAAVARWAGAGHRQSRLSDVTRPDVIQRIRTAVARWASHATSPGSRCRRNSARAGPGRPFTDARRATGSPGSP